MVAANKEWEWCEAERKIWAIWQEQQNQAANGLKPGFPRGFYTPKLLGHNFTSNVFSCLIQDQFLVYDLVMYNVSSINSLSDWCLKIVDSMNTSNIKQIHVSDFISKHLLIFKHLKGYPCHIFILDSHISSDSYGSIHHDPPFFSNGWGIIRWHPTPSMAPCHLDERTEKNGPIYGPNGGWVKHGETCYTLVN